MPAKIIPYDLARSSGTITTTCSALDNASLRARAFTTKNHANASATLEITDTFLKRGGCGGKKSYGVYVTRNVSSLEEKTRGKGREEKKTGRRKELWRLKIIDYRIRIPTAFLETFQIYVADNELRP